MRRTNLTPRSQEAFRKSGVLPEEIIYPLAEHFDGPEDIVQIKLKKAIYARDLKMRALYTDYQKVRDLDAGGKWDPE